MAVTGHVGGTVKFTAQNDYVSGLIFVLHMRWTFDTAVLHDKLLVSTLEGEELFPSIADGPAFIDIMPLYRWVNGIITTTLDGGELLVYTR